MSVRDMQDELFFNMSQAIEQLRGSNEENNAKVNKGSKGVYRAAQAIKWQAKRIARMAYAIEVLESIDPRYGNWSE